MYIPRAWIQALASVAAAFGGRLLWAWGRLSGWAVRYARLARACLGLPGCWNSAAADRCVGTPTWIRKAAACCRREANDTSAN
eukprot:6238506-Heterocapsa_arctica.AAC.1